MWQNQARARAYYRTRRARLKSIGICVDCQRAPRRHGKHGQREHGQREHALCASCAQERKLLWHIRYSRVTA